MTKMLMMAAAAALLAGAPAAFASCMGDAMETRAECMRTGGGPGECAAMYRDDVRECRRYVHEPVMRMRRPPPPPMHH